MSKPVITNESVDELISSGAVCDSCHGIHVPDIDSALLASQSANDTGVRVPWCDCEGCLICKDFRSAVARLMKNQSYLDPVNYPEDAL